MNTGTKGSMNKNNSIVAVYPSHTAAEAAIKELQQSGFDMKKLSIVGRDYHTDEHVIGYYNAGERMKYWGKMGAFWGGIWGMLFGSAFFLIPGVGPLIVAGPRRLDRWGAGRRRRGGRSERGWGRLVQPGHPQEQHSAVQNGPQDRQVCPDCPRHGGGSNPRQGYHRPHQSGDVGGTPALERVLLGECRGSVG